METGLASGELIELLEEALAATVDDDGPIRARVRWRVWPTPCCSLPRSTGGGSRDRRGRGGAADERPRRLASALYVWHIVGWTPTNVHERVRGMQ